MSRLIILMIVGLLILASPLDRAFAAQDIKQATDNLSTLRTRIQQLQQQMQRDRSHQAELGTALKQAERQLADATTALDKLNQQIQMQRERHTDLVKRSEQVARALQTDRRQLTNLLRTAYQMGSEPTLKLFLNQQDPAMLNRMMIYYDYFNRARMQDMASLTQRLTQLTALRQQVVTVQSKLDTLQAEQASAIDEIAKTKQQRQQALAALNAQLSTQQKQLDTLRQNESQLQALIVKLQRELERQRQRELARRRELERQRQRELARQRSQTRTARQQQPDIIDTTSRFASLRGKLPWPTQGRLAARYGSSRYEGKMRWNGILIKTTQGSPIQAVASGTVIFADALPGYGRVLIISHGNGYLTLYGQMDTLAKRKDDDVAAGDNLGQAGSGVQGESGLYFEIRKGSRTLDPGDWLTPRS